jgi:AcrR family transcriptional regulator
VADAILAVLIPRPNVRSEQYQMTERSVNLFTLAPMATREVVRTPRGERRRGLIVDAARAVFAKRGYDGASIVEIADEAGIAKSVIYDHFASKAELLKAVVTAAADERRTKVAEAVRAQAAGRPTDRLRAGVDALLRYVEDHPDAWALLASDPPADPELRAFRHQLQQAETERFAALFIHYHVDDPTTRQRKEILAEFLRTGLNGLARWWQQHPDLPREDVVDTIVGLGWFSTHPPD